jgi:hypothetical protein
MTTKAEIDGWNNGEAHNSVDSKWWASLAHKALFGLRHGFRAPASPNLTEEHEKPRQRRRNLRTARFLLNLRESAGRECTLELCDLQG